MPYLVFATLLLGVETWVRALRPPLSTLELFVSAPEQQAQLVDRQNVRIFVGDPLLAWKLVPNLREALWDFTRVTTNAAGVRYPREIGKKARGAVRVLCFGDSVTFGYRAPLVFLRRPDDYNRDWVAYPVLLERRLRAANPGRVIEVIPLAVPGYSSHQGLAWARRDLAGLQPDLVTACFGWNDIGRRPVSDRVAIPTEPWNVAGRTLISKSQALAYAWRGMQSQRARGAAGRTVPRSQLPMRVARDVYVANVLEIARLAEAVGARSLVLGSVFRDNVAHPPEGEEMGIHRAALRAGAAARGIPYLEIPEMTESGHPGNQDLFGEHIHPNHRGHRRMAEQVLGAIAAQGLLPGLVVPTGPGAKAAPPPGDPSPETTPEPAPSPPGPRP